MTSSSVLLLQILPCASVITLSRVCVVPFLPSDLKTLGELHYFGSEYWTLEI